MQTEKPRVSLRFGMQFGWPTVETMSLSFLACLEDLFYVSLPWHIYHCLVWMEEELVGHVNMIAYIMHKNLDKPQG